MQRTPPRPRGSAKSATLATDNWAADAAKSWPLLVPGAGHAEIELVGRFLDDHELNHGRWCEGH